MDRVRLRGDRRRAGPRWLVAGATLLLMAAAPPASSPVMAQERGDTATCRCVDRSGNEIENCRCLRVFSAEPLRAAMGSLTRRAMVGVYIDAGQGAEADRQGARIERVQEGGPADEAGLQNGDVVVSVGGQSVFDPLPDAEAEADLDLEQSIPVQRFQHLVRNLEPGEPVELVVLRDGSRRKVTVTPTRGVGMVEFRGDLADALGELRLRSGEPLHLDLEELRMDQERLRGQLERLHEREWTQERPGVYRFETPRGEGRFRLFMDSLPTVEGQRFSGTFRMDPCFQMSSTAGQRVWVMGGGNCVEGVELVELNPELGAYFGTERGVLVAEVAEESELGLRPGDVLLAVDGREVTEVEQARRILTSYGADEEMRLRVRRQGQEMEVLGRRR